MKKLKVNKENEFLELLPPITGDDPSGESLVYDNIYDQIKEARREDDPNIPKFEWEGEIKKANWRLVKKLCFDSLKARTKDLQIAAWMTEALFHLEGLNGLNKGLELNINLIEKYWDSIYPKYDDIKYRLAPLEWINLRLTEKVRQQNITFSDIEEIKSYSYFDWLSAQKVAGRNPVKFDKGYVKFSDIQESQLHTSSSFYKNIKKDSFEVLKTIKRFNSVITEKCKKGENVLYRLKRVIRKIHLIAKSALEQRNEYTSSVVGEIEMKKTSGNQNVSSSAGPISNRADAYHRLAEVAEYLVRVEPHSPTPYLIKRAIAWGNMSLSELLQEVVQDKNGLGQAMNLLGIMPGGVKAKTPGRDKQKYN